MFVDSMRPIGGYQPTEIMLDEARRNGWQIFTGKDRYHFTKTGLILSVLVAEKVPVPNSTETTWKWTLHEYDQAGKTVSVKGVLGREFSRLIGPL